MVALTQSAVRGFSGTVARPELRPRRVAVVLNARARKVGDEALAWIRAVVPHDDLFLSQTLEDLGPICDMLVARRYDAVLWGGGDGTFVQGTARLLATCARRTAQMPDVGVLRLGTGNAVAETLGAAQPTPDGLALDLSRSRAHARRRELAMLECEGQPSVFCGFGLDAMIQDDYNRTVGWLKKTGIAPRLESAGARYFISVATQSIPRFAVSTRPEVVAINRGTPAIRVDVDGRQVGDPIPAGRVLWRGRASLASAATVPYYGLGLKMFPHAQKSLAKFQLRLADSGTFEALSHLREIWRGAYQGETIHDFLCDEVELMLSRPAPFQSGGDLVGDRSNVTISLSPRRLSVI
jgi:diacylglycerol kinase family enzyme